MINVTDIPVVECLHGARYLHFGTTETILFQKWSTSNIGGLLGSCLVVMVLAVLVEGLVVLRKYLSKKYATNIRHRMLEMEANESSRLVEEQAEGQIRFFSWSHLILTALYGLQTLAFYLLMLIAMTFNVYLLMSIVIGASIGYFMFAWLCSVKVNTATVKR
ncbi:high affinity copper uptake protein 1-like [Lytechinus variegatus]|uniref:high affinity copper uptake protein 1-like n=1 Tax=Lytechinus variegatus TaxID=7654 RepID=UPI001BB2142D|nr:high affinity copper uptake protein 1-like [Lytechinus variegatus]